MTVENFLVFFLLIGGCCSFRIDLPQSSNISDLRFPIFLKIESITGSSPGDEVSPVPGKSSPEDGQNLQMEVTVSEPDEIGILNSEGIKNASSSGPGVKITHDTGSSVRVKQFEMTSPDSGLRDQDRRANPEDMKFIAYAWGMNLTAERGKNKAHCFCGYRRIGGGVPAVAGGVKKIGSHKRPDNKTPPVGRSSEALVNEFPWRVAIQGGPSGVFCGGSIISNSWIITAARCLSGLDDSTVIYVNVGDHDITTVTETDNVVIRANHWVIHPDYDRETFENDIGLIRLERDLQFRANIQPICLPFVMNEEHLNGASVQAGGWGPTWEEGSPSPVLIKANIPVLTTEQCQFIGHAPSDNVICTLSHGVDACESDTGSTIDLFDPELGRYHAVGITSHGDGCGEVGQPRMYTKIWNYLPFIEAVTRSNFCVK